MHSLWWPPCPPELAYWVGHWARNPASVPKHTQEDEFSCLDLGDLNIWLWSHTVAPDTCKGKFIAALWDIFLTIGRWVELASDNGWALPTANDLHNNILTQWAWEDGSTLDNVKPRHLAWWLGHKAGVTPDRARDLLEPYACHCECDMYFSHTAQEAHNKTLTRQAHKTILVTAGHPTTPPLQLSIAQLPPQCQAASLPDYPMHRHQSMPDLLSMFPPWTPNPWQCHWHHQHPHPCQWMWTRPPPHLVVKISGWIHL